MAPRDSRSWSTCLCPKIRPLVLTDQNPREVAELVPGPMQHARPACTVSPFQGMQPDRGRELAVPTGVKHAFSGHRGHLKTVTLSLGSEM